MNPPTQPSATPRTDAAFRKCVCHNLDLHVLAGDMAKMEVELAASKAECERLKADVTRETTVCDTACMEAQRLRAEVEKLTIADHAWRTAAKFDAHNAEVLQTEIERLKEGRPVVSASLYDETLARAERAEAEVLAQAALLGRSAEREADLLGKLSRAEAQLAAARKDSQRLDWLERNVQEVGFERMNERVLGGCSFDRDAIDAAMKGTP